MVGELVGLYKQKKIHNLSELVNEILSRDAKELVEELLDGAAPRATETKFLSSFRNLAEDTMSGIVQQEQESLKIFVDEDIRYGMEANTRQANPQMIEEGKAILPGHPGGKTGSVLQFGKPYYRPGLREPYKEAGREPAGDGRD